jgi:hypothetical protein
MIESAKLDSIFREPINQVFVTLINGLSTFRSYNKVDYYKKEMMNNLEKCANASFSYLVATRYIGTRLDLITLIFTIATSVLVFCLKGSKDSGLLALILQIMTDTICYFSYALR